MKDYRTFLRLQEAFDSKQKEATNLMFAGAQCTTTSSTASAWSHVKPATTHSQ
jgi:hypothetical protein